MSKEVKFKESEILLSTTDLDSRIKYANKSFCDIAGYSLDEMSNNPHNMVRHPDMPKAAFKNLWGFIQSGKSWMGPVKNRCKNGDYYWVNAFVTPIKNERGEIFEYQSVRTAPDRQVVNRADALYEQLNQGNTPKKVKFQTDISLWVQLLLLVIVVLSTLAIFTSEASLWLSISSLFVSFIALVIFSFWRKKYVEVVNQAKSVFDNPLMSYIYSGNNDDIGAISLALKMRQAELNAIVGRVSDDSASISETAKESSDSGNNVANILNDQKCQTEQIATAINQMSSTVQEIAQVVATASTSAQESLDISNDGQSVVKETIVAISELTEQLTEVESAISRLVSGSQAITTVLDEISSIADQTNLLALNAAIEAARAGEQGRGFAVVAEEVRALAMRSQQSTEEISKLLAQLQVESDSATSAMNKGNELSQNCVERVNQTGDSLTNITAEVSELANINIQIATAVEEQSVVAEQINQNIITISDMSAESEEHGKHAVVLSQSLLERLNQQHSLVKQFRK
ncbi:methyl-accepting chemotaxis protein [Litorilituus lipolyticus]|uniref:PAS domain S-box protein n=1 Tax=Litorilituus lipolyticus TaxID=2491017 RepID=A0A502LA52_9GAMM|nr:PAS domain-containing methyl-accepting chemotaxis protein [Litorilituus lipolyticus]TPH19275.1 PAS domain S-box protein [Litorilituus lipolyticus]